MAEKMERFTNKVVFVTGAGNGIGRSIALSFASEGACLSILDIESDSLQQVATECSHMGSCRVISYVADVSDSLSVQEAILDTIAIYKRFDILINNAGVMCKGEFFEETNNDVWLKSFQINVMGVVNGCRSVIPIMKSQRSGRIINATSMYGIVPQIQRAPYSATKAAVITITQVLAAELGPFGVTVNAYAPGTALTRMSAEAVSGTRANQKLKEIPVGRFAKPEEIASAVLFLASEEACYINGVILQIDGGRLSVQNPDRIWSVIADQPS